ncbi:hypothetical protein AB1Y20_002761 [Prymnesium parvum]|uniref:Chloride channel protein n=1 Tax=Prymnesium parvum TaxID=97485 RepID=A0AB34JCQ6_PRYPA
MDRSTISRLTEPLRRAKRSFLDPPQPTDARKQAMRLVDSMSFIAPDNTRHHTRAARGTRQGTTSLSAECAAHYLHHASLHSTTSTHSPPPSAPRLSPFHHLHSTHSPPPSTPRLSPFHHLHSLPTTICTTPLSIPPPPLTPHHHLHHASLHSTTSTHSPPPSTPRLSPFHHLHSLPTTIYTTPLSIPPPPLTPHHHQHHHSTTSTHSPPRSTPRLSPFHHLHSLPTTICTTPLSIPHHLHSLPTTINTTPLSIPPPPLTPHHHQHHTSLHSTTSTHSPPPSTPRLSPFHHLHSLSTTINTTPLSIPPPPLTLHHHLHHASLHSTTSTHSPPPSTPRLSPFHHLHSLSTTINTTPLSIPPPPLTLHHHLHHASLHSTTSTHSPPPSTPRLSPFHHLHSLPTTINTTPLSIPPPPLTLHHHQHHASLHSTTSTHSPPPSTPRLSPFHHLHSLPTTIYTTPLSIPPPPLTRHPIIDLPGRTALSDVSKMMLSSKLYLVHLLRQRIGPLAAIGAHAAIGVCFVSCAYACVAFAPYAKGSGLPHLIAYLNGCKLRGFTSSRTLFAKLLGTSFSLASGLCVGPEGPIIHMGGCIGSQLLHLLHKAADAWPNKLVVAFSYMRNELDKRDFVAIGAGAGITAAFLAPISGTIFVVEEACSHFSLSLLWRAFTASIAALWTSHWLLPSLDFTRALPDGLHSGDERSTHKFEMKFDEGQGVECSTSDMVLAPVIALAVLGGLVGVAFNVLLLRANRLRAKILRGRRAWLLADSLVIALATSAVCVGTPELFGCAELSVGWLEHGIHTAPLDGCAAEGGACGGPRGCCLAGLRCAEGRGRGVCVAPPDGWSLADVCMSAAFEEQVRWTNGSVCVGACLSAAIKGPPVSMLATNGPCVAPLYSPIGSLAPDEAVRALFLRGSPHAIPKAELLVALLVWFVLTVLTAGIAVPLGLMVPLIVIGGCLGRLFCLLLLDAHAFQASTSPLEPGLFALLGSTAVLAGSGQIRLFFTVVMLEVTDQLNFAPYVALTAIVSVLVANCLVAHGLYHALIEEASLPYVPHERPPDFDIRHHATHDEQPAAPLQSPSRAIWQEPPDVERVLVADIMSTTLVTIRLEQTKADVERAEWLGGHHGFPVLCRAGKLRGLLQLGELAHFASDTPLWDIIDRAPCCVHLNWPVERAHRLFASLGLRHIIVMDAEYQRPVGMVTRHDLQHSHWRPRHSRQSITRTWDGAEGEPSAFRSATSTSQLAGRHTVPGVEEERTPRTRSCSLVDDERLVPLIRSVSNAC